MITKLSNALKIEETIITNLEFVTKLSTKLGKDIFQTMFKKKKFPLLLKANWRLCYTKTGSKSRGYLQETESLTQKRSEGNSQNDEKGKSPQSTAVQQKPPQAEAVRQEYSRSKTLQRNVFLT